jgi:predicted site-specific integrase-resolvase
MDEIEIPAVIDNGGWPPVFTRTAYARYLGISARTFDRWTALGQIARPMNACGHPRWSRAVVTDFHQKTTTRAQRRVRRAA